MQITNLLENDHEFDDIEIVAYSTGGCLVIALHRAGVCTCRITLAPHRPDRPDPPPQIIAEPTRPQPNRS